MKARMDHIRDRNLLMGIYWLFYYSLLLSFFVDGRLLSQYRPIFLNHNRDLTELALIATGLPRLMMAHPLSFSVADALAFLLPIPLCWQALRRSRFSVLPGIIFFFFFALYLLLDDIFWEVHHEPYILLLLLALTWTTRRPDRFYWVLKGCRFYFLYIFVSAACWKIVRGAVFNPEEMSRILLIHHSDLLAAPCALASCRAYQWLIGHTTISYLLYLAGAVLEASFIVGFFTRRWDRVLIGLAIVFVIADLLVMRIPYWTILIGCFPLWLHDLIRPQGKKILVYETTHHENLPALLDCCRQQFDEVTVFLKEMSYHHLDGNGSPEQRWPGMEFFIQPPRCGNRRFLSALLDFRRRHGYSHIHFATLDNNLLLVALRLIFLRSVHISITIHEVNEYTSGGCRDVRDATETVAKFFLHRRVWHYHVFLPAMAEQLTQRLPGTTVVFIPSRFYPTQRPSHPTQHPSHQTQHPSHPTEHPSHRTEHPSRSSPDNSTFRLVIPGSLDPNRRDYDEVQEALGLILAENTIPAMTLVLLGDASTRSGADIVAAFHPLTGDRLTLQHFSGYIPESTYEAEILRANLLWSPLKIDKEGSRGRSETYGLTTASGLTADILLNDIPALVPAGFRIPEAFLPAINPYGTPAEAAAIVRRFLRDPQRYRDTRKNISHALSFFSEENFRAVFKLLIS